MSGTNAVPRLPSSPGGVRVDRVLTHGLFELDGGSWEVDNNVWIVGDDRSAVVIDAAHDAEAILAGVGERELLAILCTHAHNDHVNAVADLYEATGATEYLHPEDDELWLQTYSEPEPENDLEDGDVLEIGDVEIEVIHTPGHSPGSCCFHIASLGLLFSGDTLFQGGPGATGRSFSDFPTIIASIRDRLLTLPPETVVLTGHGDATTIGDEAPHLQEWVDRGH